MKKERNIRHDTIEIELKLLIIYLKMRSHSSLLMVSIFHNKIPAYSILKDRHRWLDDDFMMRFLSNENPISYYDFCSLFLFLSFFVPLILGVFAMSTNAREYMWDMHYTNNRWKTQTDKTKRINANLTWHPFHFRWLLVHSVFHFFSWLFLACLLFEMFDFIVIAWQVRQDFLHQHFSFCVWECEYCIFGVIYLFVFYWFYCTFFPLHL